MRLRAVSPIHDGAVLAMGRPRKSVDTQKLRLLAARMNSVEDIARVLDVSKDTLERNFADVIERGRAEARGSLRAAQFAAALNGSPALLIWLGKVLLGQRETVVVEATAAVTHETPVATVTLEEGALQIIQLINDVRARNGRPALDPRVLLGDWPPLDARRNVTPGFAAVSKNETRTAE